MQSLLLTWYQALQLVALGPCLFVIFFLCVTARNFSKIVVPVLYFISLACNFIFPLGDLLGFSDVLQEVLMVGKSVTSALSFLLIIEFITGNMPALAYWLVLAVPLVGGGTINHVASAYSGGEICIDEHLCAAPLIFRQLYEIFSACLIFLLTIVMYQRIGRATESNTYTERSKYAIILSVIILNLVIVALRLLYVSGNADIERMETSTTVVMIGFIYLALTYIFRVFDRSFEIAYERVPTIIESKPTERDIQLAESVRKLMSQEKLYHTMELSREMLAKKLAVTENQLSRVINRFFSQNFNMLVNGYRIEEAKGRLVMEDTAITTIAFEVGFSSIPSFNRVFKQVTGLSPTEYRSKNSSEDPVHNDLLKHTP